MELQGYKGALEEREGALTAQIVKMRGELVIESGGDHLDLMGGMERRDRAAGELMRLSGELGRVHGALRKIEREGDVLGELDLPFGVCEDCEEEISEARLKVRPEVKYCLKCQTIKERE